MRKGIFTIVVVCIISVLSISEIAHSDTEAGRVLAIKKNVFRVRENSREDAKPQMPLLKKDAVETDKKSRTKLFFTDDSILNLGELSRVEVEEYLYSSEKERSKSIYRLMDGYMKVIVGRSDLEIHTPTAVASARGTKFIVSVEEIGKVKFTRIIVLEGKVETWSNVQNITGSVIVQQGQMNKVPLQKPPESVKPIEMKVMEKFVKNTVVISDVSVAKAELPALLETETDPGTTGPESEPAEPEAASEPAESAPPPPPPSQPKVIKQQPTQGAFTPVTINVNFP